MIRLPPFLLLAVMTAILAYATLTPFNFLQRNRAEIRPGGGIAFSGYSTAYPLNPPRKLARVDSLTIVLRLETAMRGGQGILLDYAASDRGVNLRIEQWRNDLLFSVGTSGPRQRCYLALPDAMKPGEAFTAVFFYDGRTLSGWQSRGKAQRATLPQGSRRNWDPEASLSLGSTVNGKFDWSGTLYSLAVYDRILTLDDLMSPGPDGGSSDALLRYEFTSGTQRVVRDMGRQPVDDLVIPDRALAPRRELLASPSDYWHAPVDDSDVILNILVFVPYGYILAIALRSVLRRPALSMVTAVLLVTAFSLSIETLQHFLPTRNSSLMDVISNSIGGVIGVLLIDREWPGRVLASMGIQLGKGSA
jgi:hypothetical protein